MGALDGKVAIVTGSSSGIGTAVAQRFAAEGAAVVVNSSSSVDAGTALAASLPKAIYVQASIAEPADCRRLVDETIAAYGRLDILVNNAGRTRIIDHFDLESVTPEVWHDILDLNLIGTWEMTKVAVPHLKATGAGQVVMVGSAASIRPSGSSIPYAVSKAGLNHMTKLLGRVLGPEIAVNAVLPGLIDTPWGERLTYALEQVNTRAPLKRVGHAEDIANAIMGIVTTTYMTGQLIAVDGGMSFT
ncbi:MAG: SDR family NAD(P)-dependent oxidoreductase [Acidimicrobiia bacterium]